MRMATEVSTIFLLCISSSIRAHGLAMATDRHGTWNLRYPDGRTDDGEYVDDHRDGRWSHRYPGASRVFGAYWEGLFNGGACWKIGRWIGEPGLCTE